jgi:hypothetical protein
MLLKYLAVPERGFALNPDSHLTRETPPTFVLQAKDDPVDPVENSEVATTGGAVPGEDRRDATTTPTLYVIDLFRRLHAAVVDFRPARST